MRDYNPNDPLDPNRTTVNDPGYARPERSGMSTMGIMVAIALALGLGLVAWGMMDSRNDVADNRAPGVTTGSTTTSPPAPAPTPPPASGGNATR